MEIEVVGTQSLGQVKHHPMVVQREMQANRLAEQNNAPDLSFGETFFQRPSKIVAENRPDLRRPRQAAGFVPAAGERLETWRLVGAPKHPRCTMVGQVLLDGLPRRLRDVQDEIDGGTRVSLHFKPPQARTKCSFSQTPASGN